MPCRHPPAQLGQRGRFSSITRQFCYLLRTHERVLNVATTPWWNDVHNVALSIQARQFIEENSTPHLSWWISPFFETTWCGAASVSYSLLLKAYLEAGGQNGCQNPGWKCSISLRTGCGGGGGGEWPVTKSITIFCRGRRKFKHFLQFLNFEKK